MVQKDIARCNSISKVARDLFMVVSIFLVLFEISTAQTIHYNGLNRDGSHVCSDNKYRQTAYHQRVATVGYVIYNTKCGLFGWKRCRRSRKVTRYRNQRYYRRTSEIYLRCCSGWTRQTESSKSCDKPVCERGCNNYGECIGPNTCKCRPGWKGSTCSDDINECFSDNGGCQQLCINRRGNPVPLCSCRRGYIRDPSNKKRCIDVDECRVQNACHCRIQGHNCAATCSNTAGGFSCGCSRGYYVQRKTLCTDYNECANNNGGCSHSCLNQPGNYSCGCPRGFRLDTNSKLCRDVNECDINNGNCQQMCKNLYGRHSCSCREGFVLDSNKRTCSDLDECKLGEDDCDHICENNPMGGYRCQCDKGYELSSDNRTCQDVDECVLRRISGSNTVASLSGCHHECFNYEGGFECFCRNGFLLMYDTKRCQDINECNTGSHFCEQRCQNTDGSFHCSCKLGFILAPDGRSCKALPCESILPPRHGRMSCSGLVTNATCTFSCDAGYELVGSKSRTCLPSSGWNGKLTACKAKQCGELTTKSMEQTVLVPCFSSLGSTCRFGCRPGFFMQGDGRANCSLNSKDDGVSWSTGQFSCEEIRTCLPNPCRHGGKCLVLDKESFICNCSGTGYRGSLCQTGVINTPIFPKLRTKTRSRTLRLKARPSDLLQVSFNSSKDLILDPPSLEFAFSKIKAEFVVKTGGPGIHAISYRLDGKSKDDFQTPLRSVVLVAPDVVGLLPRAELPVGCMEIVTNWRMDCGMRLLSTKPWAGTPASTTGIVHLVTPNNISLPMSMVGLNVKDLNVPRDELMDIAISKTSSQKRFNISKQTNGKCLSKVSTSDDLLALMWSDAFPSSFMRALTEIAPDWLGFAVIENNTAFDVQNVAVTSTADSEYCSGFPFTKASSFIQVFYRPALNYNVHVAQQTVALFADGTTCFVIDICHSAIIVNFPENQASILKNSLNVFRYMKTIGLDIKLGSVGLFNKIERYPLPVKITIWNGIKLIEMSSFNYNMWLKGSLKWKMNTQSRLLFVTLEMTGQAFVKYREISTLFHNSSSQRPSEVQLNGTGGLTLKGRVLGKDFNMKLVSAVITGKAALRGKSSCDKSVLGVFLTSEESVRSWLNQSPFSSFLRPKETEHLRLAIHVSLSGDANVETILQGISLHFRGNLCVRKFCFNDLNMEIDIQGEQSCTARASSTLMFRAKGKVLKTVPSSSEAGSILTISRHRILEIVFPPDTERVSVNFEAKVNLFNISQALKISLQNEMLRFELQRELFHKHFAHLKVKANTKNVEDWSALRFFVQGRLPNMSQLSKLLQTKVRDLIKYLAEKAAKKVRNIENFLLEAKRRINSAETLVRRKELILNSKQREKQRKYTKLQRTINAHREAKISLNSSLMQFLQLKNKEMCEYQNCSYIDTGACLPTVCQRPIVVNYSVPSCQKKTESYFVSKIETTEEEEIEWVQTYKTVLKSNCGSSDNLLVRFFESVRDFFSGCDSYMEKVPAAVIEVKHKVLRHNQKKEKMEKVVYDCKEVLKSVTSSYSHPYECCLKESQHGSAKIQVLDLECVSENRQCHRNMTHLRRVIQSEQGELVPYFESVTSKAQRVVTAQLEMSRAKADFDFANNQLKLARANLEQHEHAKNAINVTTVKSREQLGLKLSQKLQSANGKPLVIVDTITFSVSITKRSLKTRFPVTATLRTVEGTGKDEFLEFPMDFTKEDRSLTLASRLIVEELFGSIPSRKRRSIRDYPTSSSEGTLLEGSLSWGQDDCHFSLEAHVYFSDVVDAVERFVNDSKELEASMMASLRGIENLHLDGSDNDRGPLEEIQSTFDETLKSIRQMFLIDTSIAPWNASLDNLGAFLDVLSKSKNFSECSGFQDCVGFFFDSLWSMYEREDHPRAIAIKEALKKLEKLFGEILNEDSTADALRSKMSQAKALVLKSKDDIILCSKKPSMRRNSPVEIVTTEGENIHLLCEAESPIELLYLWYKDGEPLEDTNSTILKLPNVTSENQGVYQCQVSNSRGSTMSNVTILKVQQKPQITEQPLGTQMLVGAEMLLLKCNSTGFPRPLTEWFFKPIEGDFKGHVFRLNTTKPTLAIHNVTFQNAGIYYCNVSNQHGTVQSREAKVDVLDFYPGTPRIAVAFGITSCKKLSEADYETNFNAPYSFWTKFYDVLGGPARIIENLYFNPFPNASVSFVLSVDDIQVPRHYPPAKRLKEALNMFSLSRISMGKSLKTLYPFLTNGSLRLEKNEAVCVEENSFSVAFLPQRCPNGTEPHKNGFLCVNCAVGYYGVVNGTCLPCPSGSYQPNVGRTECIKCPFRRSRTESGAFAQSQCINISIPCRPLIPTIKNAQPPSQKKQLYRSGETIEVQCENGYRGIGNATWECNEGNWTSTTDFYCQKACLPPWTEFRQRCYKVTAPRSYSWRGASARCYSMQSHILSITSDEENSFVAKLVKAYVNKNNLGQVHMWLGLFKAHSGGEFQWVDGNPLGNYSNWAPGEPNNARNKEQCSQMLAFGNVFRYKMWNDVRCDWTRYKPITVCEKAMRKGA